VDLSLNTDQELLAESVRAFVQRDASTEVLTAVAGTPGGVNPSWHASMSDAGWLGIVVGSESGGVDASALEAAIVCEELGRGPVPGPFLASSIVSALLIGAAEPSDQRDRLLAGIAEGDCIVSPVLRAPDGTWSGLERGHDTSGVFPFVPQASNATHFVLPAAKSGSEAIEIRVVAASDSGVAVRPLAGLLAGSFELTVPDTAPVNALHIVDRAALRDTLARAYVLVAAYQVGGCQAVLERSIDYSNTRKQFSVPIGKFQRVQDHIVEILNATDAARWTMLEAAWKLDAGKPARAGAHLAAATASESYLAAVDYAHKVHGGIGVDPQYGLTLFTAMSRSLYEFLGHPKWHRRRMLAELEKTV
jgi:alkylation response protein AidB-like acyl-CoA dehydrogenase